MIRKHKGLRLYAIDLQYDAKRLLSAVKDPNLSRDISFLASERAKEAKAHADFVSKYVEAASKLKEVKNMVILPKTDPFYELITKVQQEGIELYISDYEAHYQLDNFIYIFKAVDKNDHEIRISEVITKEVE